VFFHIWEHNPSLLHKLAEEIQAGSAAPSQLPEHSPELALVRSASDRPDRTPVPLRRLAGRCVGT
jgi:hypothetical protein